MSEKVISPDLGFVNDVIKAGGESLKKCYQCATCTVVCNMTPDDKPFPRKEMVQAQWGMREELLSNPDIWLCHQCSDCTAYCPRGAKPGEVLGAIRKMSLVKYSKPGFLANMVNDPRFLLPLLAVPLVIYLIILSLNGHLDFSKPYLNANGEMSFSAFLDPTKNIDPVFVSAALFAAISFGLGIFAYWTDMSKNHGAPRGNIVTGVISTALEILGHGRFKKCDLTGGRSVSHFIVFYSFVGLAITTTIAVIYLYLMHLPSPYKLTDPLKIIGNISAAGLLLGIAIVIANRFINSAKAGLGSYYDWLFIGVVAAIALTGTLAEVTRLAGIPGLAYPIYVAHLMSVFFLFFYAPFSKMAHMAYRTTAMVYANMTGRK